jgi:dTDP-glucose 4,6-dehydratase
VRAVVTGGAGFLGSHLCDRLLGEGWEVVCLDTLLTGATGNLDQAMDNDRFTFVKEDVTSYVTIDGTVDWVFHLASPASPIDYIQHPIKTLKIGALGTLNSLGLAKSKGASFFLASTSEVYGDPLVHPQPEAYWGNVNPVGPRSVYDEAKRYAEAMTVAYFNAHQIDVKIARIFNTYGPRMRKHDGRAVPEFINQSLRGLPLTVHGDGSQTRSLCFVDDLIEGFWALVNSDERGPVNIGNPHEITVLELAESIVRASSSSSEITFVERPVDDPERRCPDLTLARERLGWEPKVPLDDGLARTIEWARSEWMQEGTG